jgi:hypothetical protein
MILLSICLVTILSLINHVLLSSVAFQARTIKGYILKFPGRGIFKDLLARNVVQLAE